MTDVKKHSWREELGRLLRGEKPSPPEELPEPMSGEELRHLICTTQPLTGPEAEQWVKDNVEIVREGEQ